MPPLSLRLALLFVALSGPLLLVGCVVVAECLGVPILADEIEGPLALSLLAAAGAPAVLALLLARSIRSTMATVDEVTKSLLSGSRLDPPVGARWAELSQSTDRLVQAAAVTRSREATLRATDRAKDGFLAMLGHELRNPLAALAAVAHVLRQKGAKDDATRKATDVLTRQVQHMSRLIEDLLDVSRVTRGKVSLNRQPLEFSRAVDKAIGELRVAGRLDRHDVRLDLRPVWVRADEARIEQIVTNLIGNAVKYTPAQGTIEVALRRDHNAAVLRVRDSGIGMSADLVAKVFDLFVQGETPGRQAGLGIGLTLVRHLAELHGGKAFAASAGPGEGSVFTITLPAIEAQPAQGSNEATVTTQTQHRILLVEDNVDARNTLHDALRLGGHTVFDAADGESGIRTAAEVQPDVAIIDIGLPGRDGYEVASALRQTLARPQMVLIAVTGYEQPDSLRRAREAGFDEYVIKPIAPDRLVRLIDAAFAARARRQPPGPSRPNVP